MSDLVDTLPPLSGTEEELREAEKWLLYGHLASSSLLTLPLPDEMNEADRKQWGSDSEIQFITTSLYEDDASLQSIMAATRYANLRTLLDRFPHHVPLLLVMAECHYLMNDTHGSLRLAKRACDVYQRECGKVDAVLNHAIRMLEILAAEAAKEYEPDHDKPVYRYSRPADWVPSSTPPDLLELEMKWTELQKRNDGAAEFARYASVETNQLEGVFHVEADSSMRLARCGFRDTSIVGISPHSQHTEPEKIISILMTTQRCFDVVQSCVHENKVEFFDAPFVKALHTQLLEGDNVDIHKEVWDDQLCYSADLIPLGTYREVPCFAMGEEYETRFCPADRIDAEMEWFYAQVATILSNRDLDPYRACAWIQHAFVRIHPFCDGNGRVGRLISSIPLLVADLPPVYVSLESKKSYLAALRAADDERDIDQLATFLQRETLDAIASLRSYVPSPSSWGGVFGAGRLRRSPWYRMILRAADDKNSTSPQVTKSQNGMSPQKSTKSKDGRVPQMIAKWEDRTSPLQAEWSKVDKSEHFVVQEDKEEVGDASL